MDQTGNRRSFEMLMAVTITVMDDTKALTTPYYSIYQNAIAGLHSVLLLEYNQDAKFFLEPTSALNYLLDTE